MSKIAVDIVFIIVFTAIVTVPFTIPATYDALKIIRDNKRSRCIHLWRKNDVEYYSEGAKYYYFCEKCKSDKELWDSEAKRFEEEFMNDYL